MTSITDHDGKAEANADHLRALTEACLDDILTHPAAKSIRCGGHGQLCRQLAGRRCAWASLHAGLDLCRYARPQRDNAALAAKARAGAPGRLSSSHRLFHPSRLFPRAICLHEEDAMPNLCKQIRRISDIGGYLYRHWFGREAPISYSLASWSGLLGTERLRWHQDFIRSVARRRAPGSVARPGRLRCLPDRIGRRLCRALAAIARSAIFSGSGRWRRRQPRIRRRRRAPHRPNHRHHVGAEGCYAAGNTARWALAIPRLPGHAAGWRRHQRGRQRVSVGGGRTGP